ncbi:MAG: PAS domain-containing protein [Leptolyngbyaceae cyanobacterium bins.59]|nr:PAS domain-containing protein [Leptolyngbyaceae cyanobacterium bins.59]
MMSGEDVKVLYPAPQSRISTVFDVLPESVAVERMSYLQQALQTRTLQTYEQHLVIADQDCWEEVRIAPLTEDEVLVIIRDVTDRKQAEQALHQLNQELETRIAERTTALRESEERWQLAIQGCNDSIWDWNLKTNQIFRTSRWKTLRGYGEHELGSNVSDWSEGIHSEDYERVMQAIQDHLAGKTAFYEQEYRIQRKDGSYVWILDRGQALWDEQGNPVRMAGSETDISDRKQIEEQLRRSEAHLNMAQRIAQLGSWEFDLQTKQIFWSQEVFEIYARNPKTGVPTYAEFLKSVHPADRIRVMRTAQKVIQGENSFDIEFRVYRADGNLCHVQGRGEFNRNLDENGGRLVGTVLDITNRKQTEAELRRLNERLTLSNADLHRATRLKDEFLANMSHELRTPLNAVLGMTEGLQEEVFGPLTDRQRQALATVERSGKHLLELINDILDLSKIESEKLELQTAPVTVNQLCESSLTFVRQQAAKKDIYLTSEISENLPNLMVDERRIRQVLINLLSNAVKFTPDGGQVCLEAHLDLQASKPMLCFSVIDTGIGIAEENVGKLFQPFVQVDSRLNRQYSGTGLGLALVRRLVELHGGKVSVTSVLGEGSCFTVWLPCLPEGGSTQIINRTVPFEANAVPANPVPVEQSGLLSQSSAAPSSPLILLAEDNEANIVTISGYLRGWGYRLVVAKNGREAIDRAIEEAPDLILMDIQMPQVDGLEAIRILREHSHLNKIPIIALTAFAMSGDREQCLAAGASDYVTKPIQFRLLIEKMQRLLTVNLALDS